MSAEPPAAPPPPPAQTGASWSVGRILLVVFGSIIALLGVALLGAGGTTLWADRTQRDDDGYLTTPTERFETEAYAITSESIDLFEGEEGGEWLLTEGVLGTVRITGESPGRDVFVGIGATEDVDSYLQSVEHDEVRDIDFDPFLVDYRRIQGDRPAEPPDEQDFWAAAASGSGRQSAVWEAESGDWSIVLMNADGSPGVVADVSAGAKAGFLLWLAIGLLAAGALILAGGVTMIVFGVRGASARSTVAPTTALAEGGAVAAAAAARPTVYPAAVRGELDPDLSRWLWVVKWLLAIPHYIVLAFLWLAFTVLTVVAFFAILFTGRYPRGIFDFNLGVLRWTWRVGFYSYWALGTDRYPPFSLGEEPDYPATLHIDYPDRLSHWLPLVKWLLAIPHLILVGIFVGGWGWGWWGWGDFGGGWGIGIAGLVGILVVIAGFALVFAGSYPRSLFDFTLGLDRWVFRVAAYVSLMRDEYPPFRLDMGPAEPPETEHPVSRPEAGPPTP